MTAFGHVGSSISAENMSQGRRVSEKRTIFYDTVSAVMLLVGTQPLRSQHPPLTALPLGSAKTSPRWLEANLQVKKDVRREAPGRRRLYLGLLLLESDGRACFFGCTEKQRGNKQWEMLRWHPLPLGIS